MLTTGSWIPLDISRVPALTYVRVWQEAKADIVDNDRSKLQLESDVRLLYNLLERAKKERRSYDTTIRQLERSLAASNARSVEVSAGFT